MTRKRIAVFGASGFIGSAVVKELEEQGHDVVPVRTPRFTSVNSREVAAAVLEAYLDPRLLERIDGADAVINAAGDSQATAGNVHSLFAANSVVPGVLRRYCTAARVPRFVHVSSAAVQGRLEPLDASERYDARSPYARSKMLGERVVLAQRKVGTVVYRPPGVHARGRHTTESVRRLAESCLSCLPAGIERPSPQASLQSVAAAIAFLAVSEERFPQIVHHPSEGISTVSLLRCLGRKNPIQLPPFLCRALVEGAYRVGIWMPQATAVARRLDILWFGQEQSSSPLLQRNELRKVADDAWKNVLCSDGESARSAYRERKRLLVVSQYYPPERVWFASNVAEHLGKNGAWQTLSITGFPNYPYGKVFKGTRQCWRGCEIVNNARVLRVPLVPDHSNSALRRMVSYLSFGLSVAKEMHVGATADVVYVYATQMTAAVGPWLWNRLFGTPYVLHIQDLWPDSIVGSSIVGNSKLKTVIERVLAPFLNEAYRCASGIIAIAPTMKDILIGRGVSAEKIKVVLNWDPTRKSDSLELADPPKSATPLHLLYAGNVGEMQDVETVASAVGKFDHNMVQLTIVGDGTRVDAVRSLCDERGIRNVELLPSVSPEEVSKLYDGVHFVLVTLRDLPAFHGTIPSKLQGAAAHGVPVICSVRGDTSRLVEDYGAGVNVAPEDELGLESTIGELTQLDQKMYEQMRIGAALMFQDNFTRVRAMEQIEQSLIRAAEEGMYK